MLLNVFALVVLVENALSGERLIAEREAFLATAVENSHKALDLGRVQYEVGRSQLLDVLQLQARLVSARSGLISAQSARFINPASLERLKPNMRRKTP